MQLKNNSYLIIILLLLFIIVAVFFYSFKNKKDPGTPNQLNKIEAVRIPDRMDLAGEARPGTDDQYLLALCHHIVVEENREMVSSDRTYSPGAWRT